jgi:isopropylmalate/homocitrate/citramalate synthase
MKPVRIVEVGPRDGLQNEPVSIPTETKLAFIDNLLGAGLREIEATAFVSPKWVPQLADSAEVWARLPHHGTFSALVPNERGLETALACGVKRIAVFTAASETFTRRNINMSVDESLEVFGRVIERFMLAQGPAAEFGAEDPGDIKPWEPMVRGYVSTAFECPYEGKMDPARVVDVANRLHDLGCREIALGDTIGRAVPHQVERLAREVHDEFGGPLGAVAWHFHDTFGTAIANVQEVLGWDVFRTFDASAAGLGGCPYAPGAGGNLATEDLVYLLEKNGLATGVDLDRLARASLPILDLLGRTPMAKVQRALLGA